MVDSPVTDDVPWAPRRGNDPHRTYDLLQMNARSRSITPRTRELLFFTYLTCCFPECTEPSWIQVDGRPAKNVEIAHIHAVEERGPRYDPSLTSDQLRSFENLVLLCKKHHNAVDRAGADGYPAETIQEWSREAARARGIRVDDTAPIGATGLREYVAMSEAEYAHITERLTELQMHALATSLAPAVLKDRQSELDDLKQFCRSNHQFAWFQAPPWAGKTALLASFFLNPPAGVIPVAFFTSRRMVGQSTSEDFLSAMVDQLACISGQPSNRAYRSSLEGEYQRLLRIVPEILSHNRLKLLMVVDGLDEDTGPSVGQPSIASRIPKKPAANLCVVATSRTHPGIPVDVDADHPLRKVSPRDLRVSDHAEALKQSATAELHLHLTRIDQATIDLIAFSAVCRGLSTADLNALSGYSHHWIDTLMLTDLGRSFATRHDAGRRAPVWVFAHEELRAAAARRIAGDLPFYVARIHTRADEYRRKSWPIGTPEFFLKPYGELVTAEATGHLDPTLGALRDVETSVRLAHDNSRMIRMRAVYLSHEPFAQELNAILRQAAAANPPDLKVLGLMALRREVFLQGIGLNRGQARRRWRADTRLKEFHQPPIPDTLRRVEIFAQLAASIYPSDPAQSAELVALAKESALSIPNRHWSSQSLAAIAIALAERNREQAEDIATTIPVPYWRANALRAVATAVPARDSALPGRSAYGGDEQTPQTKIAQLLTTEDWTSALPVMALTHGDTLHAISSAALRAWSPVDS